MKSLEINVRSCIIKKDQYSVDVNGEELHKIILNNMPPEMENHKNYIGAIIVKIDIIEDELKIKKSGYRKEQGVKVDA